MSEGVKLALTCIFGVIVAALLMGLAVDLILSVGPKPAPEQCVTVHTYDDGRSIKVCDAEASARWGRG